MNGSEFTTRITQMLEPIVRTITDEIVSEIEGRRQDGTSLRSAPSGSEWMTINQLAEYWQIYNGAGQPTTAGIAKWVSRRDEDFPLPCARMGDLLRFDRAEVDRWAKEEAQRQRVARTQKQIKVVGRA